MDLHRERGVRVQGLGDTRLCINIFSCSVNLTASAALHIEWCRSRAHSMRWSEEITLLYEEMARVLKFLHWQVGWWTTHAAQQSLVDVDEGFQAYVNRQAWIQLHLHTRFQVLWADFKSSLMDDKMNITLESV
ncbi:hypothetical protein JVT61DRAFT_14890 [Boletus reticuloceps]|uniref:Uncharacterized protein n=1 Tax=Boletus reticuloceps TaxID=495285 RepID=A0A8I3A2V9_9AGAM|nr:hypothetical protein JVT61DRAFT_14890 [Boletus reticuloceps]